MRISELKKGDKATMRNVGDIVITGVAKNYIKVEAEGMKLKLQFGCNAAPLSDLGIELKVNQCLEKIISIKEVEGFKIDSRNYGSFDGYVITTDSQEIKLGISNEQSCCESWGYFMTEDDLNDFIGSDLKSIEVPDTYDGDSMFVSIHTSNGVLQFVAYNSHNGYYGHEAVVISRDFKHSESL